MKNLKIKNIALMSLTSIILVTTNACGNNANNITNTDTPNETETNLTTEKETNTTNEETMKEEESFDSFKTEKEEIESCIDNSYYELAKEKGKKYFIAGIDFIFYNEEYKGITFEELTEEAKMETLNNLTTIDNYITEFDPDYKENLAEKYEAVKDFVSIKYYQALDKIKEYITEENYNSIRDLKDSLIDNANNLGQNVKEKANEWYENFKSK